LFSTNEFTGYEMWCCVVVLGNRTITFRGIAVSKCHIAAICLEAAVFQMKPG